MDEDELDLTGEDISLDGSDTVGTGKEGTYKYDSTKSFDEMVEDMKTNGGSSGDYATISWNPFASDKVLGLPLYYNDFADPNGRVYNQSIIADIPNVYIIPGLPSINRSLVDMAGNSIVPATISRKLIELQEAGFNFGVRGIKSGNDLRFIGFKPDYSEYYKYVQTMLSSVYSYLNEGSVFSEFQFSKEFQNEAKDYGLCFYANRATSISESADNSYSASRTAEMVQGNASSMREATMLNPLISKAPNMIESIKALNPIGILESLQTFDGTITRTANALFRVVNGSNLAFPEVWQDSNFDKSYNISFKFYSPYGDKMSIFRFVYTPFIALLALALPRQDGLLGYEQPFFLKMSSPG